MDPADSDAGRVFSARRARIAQAAILLLCFQARLTAQPDTGANTVLKSIRERALKNVRTLPNYTCTSVIERSARRSVSHRFENIDRIHLEIAYIGDSELFGWPAGERIGEQDLRRFVGGSGDGRVGSGLRGAGSPGSRSPGAQKAHSTAPLADQQAQPGEAKQDGRGLGHGGRLDTGVQRE